MRPLRDLDVVTREFKDVIRQKTLTRDGPEEACQMPGGMKRAFSRDLEV